MAWPSRQDYFLAVQNPALAFSDPELREGKPKLTPMGTPWGVNGAFASVYQLEFQSRKWAVKCFLNEYEDQSFLYQAISSCLNSSSLPYSVGFEYQPEGILVGGRRYPILKMEWINGERLDDFVKNNLNNPSALSNLADKWLTMISTLRHHSIAHGDLQHGNIFIVNGELKLIDYDGMFVPALQGREAREMGHRNYQHPSRTQFDFGPHIDNFSAWVIYISLKVLATDPVLWNRIKDAGDDRILFSKEDFDFPSFSQALRDVSRSNVPDLANLVQVFKTFVSASNLQGIPPLAEFDAPPPIGSDWIQGFRRGNASPPAAPERVVQPPSPGGSWLETHLPAPPPRLFSIPPIYETACTYTVISACLMLTGIGLVSAETRISSFLGSGLAVVVYWMVLVNRFKNSPELAQRESLLAELASADGRIERQQARLSELSRLHDALITEEQAEFQKLQEANRGIARFEQQAISQLEEELTRNRRTITSQQDQIVLEEKKQRAFHQMRIDSLKGEKVKELKRAEERQTVEIQNLAGRLKRLPLEEAESIGRALTDIHEAIVKAKLSNYRIEQWRLNGIGPITIAILHSHSIVTAADIPDEIYAFPYLQGVPVTRKQKLVDWRRERKARVLAEAPKHLPSRDEHRIRDTFKQTRKDLDEKSAKMKEELNRCLGEISNRYESAIREEQWLLDEVPKIFAPRQTAASNRLHEFERTAAGQKSAVSLRFQNERRTLEIEAKRFEAQVNLQRDILATESADVHSVLTDAQWERRKLDRDLISLAGITFPAYLKRLILRK
jgi:hypothetical protein